MMGVSGHIASPRVEMPKGPKLWPKKNTSFVAWTRTYRMGPNKIPRFCDVPMNHMNQKDAGGRVHVGGHTPPKKYAMSGGFRMTHEDVPRRLVFLWPLAESFY